MDFEDYLLIRRKETFDKKRRYNSKRSARLFERDVRNAFVDTIIFALFIIDLFLFFAWLDKKETEIEEKQIVVEDQAAIHIEHNSFDVPCPEATPAGFYNSYLPVTQHSAVFTVTHYCGCSICCGSYSSGSESEAYGASGKRLEPLVSVAVDPRVIPLGTILHDAQGNVYRAEDTGSAIKGNRIDLFIGNHQEAKRLGVKEIELWW